MFVVVCLLLMGFWGFFFFGGGGGVVVVLFFVCFGFFGWLVGVVFKRLCLWTSSVVQFIPLTTPWKVKLISYSSPTNSLWEDYEAIALAVYVRAFHNTHTHTHTHARARARARAHTHTHARTSSLTPHALPPPPPQPPTHNPTKEKNHVS